MFLRCSSTFTACLLSLMCEFGMQRDVGMFRVDAQQLKAALLPSPTALLAHLGQLLPQAAGQLYSRFVEQVHSATSILRATTSSVEDYVHQLAFLGRLKACNICAGHMSECLSAHLDYYMLCLNRGPCALGSVCC